MIDSHCHLDHEPLINNLDEIIKRSKEVGIQKLLTICTTYKSYENILKIVEKDSIIYGTFVFILMKQKNIVNKNIITEK